MPIVVPALGKRNVGYKDGDKNYEIVVSTTLRNSFMITGKYESLMALFLLSLIFLVKQQVLH